MDIRLSPVERQAIKETFNTFSGKIFMFGSRTNMKKKGGDIDILLIPDTNHDPMALKMSLIKKFQQKLEQTIDIVVYDSKKTFCQEILKHAKPFSLTSL